MRVAAPYSATILDRFPGLFVKHEAEVRKPKKREFFTVHPEYSRGMPLLSIQEKKWQDSFFLVAKSLWSSLSSHMRWYRIYVAMSYPEELFLFPARGKNRGMADPWYDSLQEMIEQAKTGWVSYPTTGHNRYNVEFMQGEDKPAWKEIDVDSLFEDAFENRIIMDMDDPIVNHLGKSP